MDARGYRTTASYDPTGRVVATQDALGYMRSIVYDVLGRAVATVWSQEVAAVHSVTVPEPGALLLLGVGGVALLAKRRRRVSAC